MSWLITRPQNPWQTIKQTQQWLPQPSACCINSKLWPLLQSSPDFRKLKSSYYAPHCRLVDAIYTIGAASHRGKVGTTKNVYWSSWWLHCFFWEGTLFTLVIAFIDGVCSTGSFQTQLWRITLASIHTSSAHTNQLSPSTTQKPTSKKVTRSQPSNQPRIVFSTVCCRFGSWGLVTKLNFCSDFEHKVWSRFWSWSSGNIFKLEIGQFCRWCFLEVMKFNRGQDSEARFGQYFEF